ncbi:MAG: RnfABCDGE type electron transport complex subunit C, partial [Clostridia bacterium]|nr:RnfABCDGE type electron transport complex subunit C [Clostridia bacterium]
LEHPERVVGGIKILLKALSLRCGIIAIEENKMDAVKALSKIDFPPEMIRICIMKTKYPQGDERQLIYALSGKELPAGKLPADLGYVVFNAETCAAIYTAFESGMPLVERIVTVDGDCVLTPGNLLVPIGTPVSDLLSYCGTDTDRVKTLISGGPMMGKALWDQETPVTKGVCAILAYSQKTEQHRPRQTACIRCGKCITACPMHLMPREICKAKSKGDLALCEDYFAMNCVECGSCSYTCPAGIELTQTIKSAKLAIRNKKAAEKEADKKEERK